VSIQTSDSVIKTSPNSLNHQVAQYSLAAVVAGVGMLAMVQPSEGEVVFTKKTIHIPLSTNGVLESVKISMANNGVDNFNFSMYTAGTYRHLLIGGSGLSDQLRITGGFDVYVAALRRGVMIGPSNPTSSFYGGGIGEISNSFSNSKFFRGSWGGNPRNRYLGVRFPINGQIHYGWIRLTVTTNPKPYTPFMSATITGYAYETVPNKAISAGTAAFASSTAAEASSNPTAQVSGLKNSKSEDGASLGMLALGAEGLPLWRREETLISK
jgi:hypothetical protein